MVYWLIAAAAVAAIAVIVYFERVRIEQVVQADVHAASAKVTGEYDALVSDARDLVRQFEDKAENFLGLAQAHESEADAHIFAAAHNHAAAAHAVQVADGLKTAITTPPAPVAQNALKA